MKKNLLKFIFSVFTMIVITSGVSAQEFIRELTNMKDWHTLIRELGQNGWLLYHDYSNKWPTFNIVNQTGSFSPYLDFSDRFLANDFELTKDGEYVFFCGERVNDTGYWEAKDWVNIPRRSALMGYFRVSDILAATPYGSVYCPFLEDFARVKLKSLNKIEILTVRDGIHLIMTGSTQSGHGCIVDASAPNYFPSMWNVFVDTLSTREVFDDVAITDNYIVITSRHPDDRTGFINIFSVPISYTTSTISNALYRGKISYSVDDTLLVKHCENDAFVTGTYSYEHTGIVIGGYNYNSSIYNLILQNNTTLAPELQLKDMSYNTTSQTLDVLQNIDDGGLLASIVWHLDQTLGSSGVLTNSHYYEDETLHSIACLKYNPNYTIASGHTKDLNRFVHFCQFLLNYHDRCSDVRTIQYTKFSKQLQDDLYRVVEIQGTQSPRLPEAFRLDYPMHNVCPPMVK